MKFYGKIWGGSLTVGPAYTMNGRMLIGVCTDDGKSYCITVSRWISERRAGNIVEVR